MNGPNEKKMSVIQPIQISLEKYQFFFYIADVNQTDCLKIINMSEKHL